MKQHCQILILLLLTFVVVSACNTSDKNNDPLPQTVVTTDSSDATGRLVVVAYNSSGSTVYSGSVVRLFLSYDDLIRNIALNSLTTDASGRADFGYVLKGNYYLTGSYTSGGTYRDTTVAQILPQKTMTRYLYLR